MYNSTHLPAYKAVFYANDPETGYYTKTPQQLEKTPVMRLQYQLKVEPTILHLIKCNFSQIIRGKETFKKVECLNFLPACSLPIFRNGLPAIDYEKLKGQKILSMCFFQFPVDNSRLTHFYFGRFYIDNRGARECFINEVIPVLEKGLPPLNTNGEL